VSAQLATRIVASLLGAILGPFLIVSTYLYVSRNHSNTSHDLGDFGALGVSVIAGAICMHFLGRCLGWFSRKVWTNVLVLAVYICVAMVLLFLYSLGFVCGMFGACL
jgi:hypothetical protein